MIRAMVAALLLVSLAAATASARTKHCTMRVYAQANANDGSAFAMPVTLPISRRNIYIEKTPTISERDVTAFRAYRTADGSFGVLLQLNDHGRLALETLSIEHRGSTLLVLVNGRAVSELLVDRRVSDGQLYMASGLNAEDIESMNKDWPQIGAKKHR